MFREMLQVQVHSFLYGTSIPIHCLLGIRGDNKGSMRFQLGINAKEIIPEENPYNLYEDQGIVKYQVVEKNW
jgi:hypothetical protein